MKKVLSSKRFQSAVGIAISIGLIVWMCVALEWKVVLQKLRDVEYLYLVPLTVVVILHYLFRALRWKSLLPSPNQGSLRDRFDAILIGNFATQVLPLRAGEFIRPLLLTRTAAISFSTTFVSVVIERFFDLSAVLILFGFILMRVDNLPGWVTYGAIILSVLAIIILVFIVIACYLPMMVRASSDSVFSRLPSGIATKLRKVVEELLSGSQVLRTSGGLTNVVFYTVWVWFTTVLMFWLTLLLLQIEPSWELAMCTTVVVALAVAAPSAPGFVGVYETACIAAFALFSLSAETATAYALISHAHQFLVLFIYAIYYMMSRGVSFSELRHARHS